MLVSCIMPTWNRRKYIRRAIECFLSQAWEQKELIIVDDGDDHIKDLVFGSGVRYARLDRRMTTGEKRNEACRLSLGEIICHFDDDDWSAPERIADQVPMLEKAEIAGYGSMFFFDEKTQKAYRFKAASPRYALGTSLMYRRSWWASHPFPAKRIGEDNHFIKEGRSKLAIKPAGSMMVAGIHSQQTSIKKTNHSEYKLVDLSALPSAFLETCQVSM